MELPIRVVREPGSERRVGVILEDQYMVFIDVDHPLQPHDRLVPTSRSLYRVIGASQRSVGTQTSTQPTARYTASDAVLEDIIIIDE